MSYDFNCLRCPYHRQAHLRDTQYLTPRAQPPIGLEDNDNRVLLVFQAPGAEEWRVGSAIHPTDNQSGTVANRVKASWERTNRTRSDFDIIYAVQCFPGREGDRDVAPNTMAACSCSNRLLQVLQAKKYTRVIVFGKLAFEVIDTLVKSLPYRPEVQSERLPSGSIKNAILDQVW